jgi:tetratricopeptide (TPR) repeat protein
MHQEKITGKQKFLNNLNSFLAKNSKILIAIFAVLIISVISLALFSSIKSSKNEESALAIEKIQNSYTEVLGKSEEESYNAELDKIIESLDSVIKNYSSYYAEQRALFLKGDILFARKDFDKASEAYTSYAEKFANTYLAPIALYNSGVCAEESGEFDKAINIYETILDKYKKSYPDISRVIFSIARLYETTENYDKAFENYTELVDNYQNSGWTNFARDRIIYLKASGLIAK